MNRTTRVATLTSLIGLVAVAACRDGAVTDLVEPESTVATLGEPSLAEISVDRPSCDGLPATIWVGMDASLVPKHALVEQLEEDPDHDHETASNDYAESGHDDGGCEGEDDEGDVSHGRWRIVGTNGPDVIVGVRGRVLIDGRNGDDVICGLAGRDEIRGGSGDDRIFGGPGPDLILGENGDDYLDGGRSPDEIRGGHGNDVLLGDRGADELYGGAGDDELYGGIGPDLLEDDQGVNLLDPGSQECGGGSDGDHEEHDH